MKEPKLHLRKVDQHVPDLEDQLEKIKADREENERNRNREASSVELMEEVINISGQPEIQEVLSTEEINRSDSPLTPLARGLVPPYTGTDTPQASGEESPRNKEVLPCKGLPSQGQQTASAESGEMHTK